MKLFNMDYTVNFRDVDRFFDMTPESFMHILGKVSTHHEIEGMGFKPGYMQERGLAWILYQWNIKLKKPKQYARNIHIETMVETRKNMYVHRYFTVLDDKNETIGWASAVWVVVDLKKRRVTKIPGDLLSILTEDSQEQEESLSEIKKNLNEETPRFRLEGDIKRKDFEVLFSDIDMNGHVTNTVYGRWAIEAIYAWDENYLLTHYPEELTSVYKKEKKPGGYITASHITENGETRMEITSGDGTVLNLIKIKWAERDETLGDYSDYNYTGKK